MSYPSSLSMIGQMFLCGFEGLSLPEGVHDLLAEGLAGGAILFGRNCQDPEQICRLTASIRSIQAAETPWIGVDQEGGRVRRLRSPFTELPPAAVLGTIDDLEQAEVEAFRFGSILGEEAAAAGFQIVFAPVLDTHTNPANPVIGDRALSSEPDRVARLGIALAKGLLESGVMPCGKHFPGHGDTAQDSHYDLPRLDHSLERLETIEMLPFRKAVEAGIPAIMSSHILFPALDPRWPATLSPAILDQILRRAWAFEGLIVSDDLEMKALADRYSLEEIVIQGLLAGIDLFLVCKAWETLPKAVAAIQQALDDGRITEERLFASYQRILQAKARFAGKTCLAGPDTIRDFLAAGQTRHAQAAALHAIWKARPSTPSRSSTSPASPLLA